MQSSDPDEELKAIQFTRAERELILGLNSVDVEMRKRFQLAVMKGERLAVPLNAYDLDELLGDIAAVANHTEEKNLRKTLDALFARISDTLESEFPLDGTQDQPDSPVSSFSVNQLPVDDFYGLSPDQMHKLLYTPFAADSPIKLRRDIEGAVLDQIPFFCLTEELLRIIEREKSIKLTKELGALPRKVLHELYSKRLITEEFIESGIVKLNRECDSVPLTTLHVTTRLSRGVSLRSGKLSLSKEGNRLLQAKNRLELFRRVLEVFTLTFNWASNDLYTEFPIGQLGWGYSIYLLLRFGSEPKPVRFYADAYHTAFPMMLTQVKPIWNTSAEREFAQCYEARTFHRFMEWFGFIRYVSGRSFAGRHNAVIVGTEILQKLFA